MFGLLLSFTAVSCLPRFLVVWRIRTPTVLLKVQQGAREKEDKKKRKKKEKEGGGGEVERNIMKHIT